MLANIPQSMMIPSGQFLPFRQSLSYPQMSIFTPLSNLLGGIVFPRFFKICLDGDKKEGEKGELYCQNKLSRRAIEHKKLPDTPKQRVRELYFIVLLPLRRGSSDADSCLYTSCCYPNQAHNLHQHGQSDEDRNQTQGQRHERPPYHLRRCYKN